MTDATPRVAGTFGQKDTGKPMTATQQVVAETVRYRCQKWIVLLELSGHGMYPWRWWAKPTRNGHIIPGVLGFSGRASNATVAVFHARDMLGTGGIADYQIYHVPALRRMAPYRWPQPHLRPITTHVAANNSDLRRTAA